jgi:hypothetical protein
MKTETPAIVMGTALILLFGIVSSFLIATRPSTSLAEEFTGSWACAADTLECPSGSSVHRVPPYCLFASCPAAATRVATN